MQHMHYDERDLPALSNIALAVQAVAGQGHAVREDASIFFARQLDYVRSQVLTNERAEMRVWDMVPRSNEIPAWAETFTTRSYDEVGMAKIISNYADDLPRADVQGTEIVGKVKDIGDSYGYNVAELRASEATGANLPTRKANAARRAHEIKWAKLAMEGEAQYGVFGLLNHPNIGSTTITGGWGAATAAAVLADLEAVVNAVVNQSNGVHRVTRIAMALVSYSLLSTKFVADSGGKSVLQIFRENHPEITLIGVPELNGAGSGGSNVLIATEFSAENYSFEIPMPFEQLPAQARNLELVVPCLSRVAGLQVWYPLALTKASGM